MEITSDFNGHDLVVHAVADQDGAGRQMGAVNAGVGVERLDFLQQVTRTLRVALAAVLAEGFLNFLLSQEDLKRNRSREEAQRGKADGPEKLAQEAIGGLWFHVGVRSSISHDVCIACAARRARR